MVLPDRLQTQRLVLRRWCPEDRAGMEAIWGDPDVAAALSPGMPIAPGYGADRLAHHVDHWERYGFGLWAVREREARDPRA